MAGCDGDDGPRPSTEEQTAAAQKMYAELDDDTKALVNAAAKEIYGDGGHTSVGTGGRLWTAA